MTMQKILREATAKLHVGATNVTEKVDNYVSEPAHQLIVGIGGTTRPGSSTERALRMALKAAEEQGARTILFDGPFLASLSMYDPASERNDAEREFIEAVRSADGLIIASPAYHGGLSGLVKNALDLLEETSKDKRPYLHSRPVGLIVTAYGWQATGATLASLRTIVHALRGWPTPFGAGFNTLESRFAEDGTCSDSSAASSLALVAQQVMSFSCTDKNHS
ncbi:MULTISPECIES: NADPH-dependent FMN reductase [Pseudomonas]|nr:MULTISPECIES: NADPH-dependent FMN reductase [Pseudomonas]